MNQLMMNLRSTALNKAKVYTYALGQSRQNVVYAQWDNTWSNYLAPTMHQTLILRTSSLQAYKW